MEENKHDPNTAIELLHHVEGLIALGENRANIIAAGNAALLVGYFSTDLLTTMFPQSGFFNQLWPAMFALMAVGFSIVALVPQWGSTIFSKPQPEHSYYFGCIGDLELEKFISEYLERSEVDHVTMILRAVHMRSAKAKQKFTLLFVATAATLLQFAPMIEWFFG